MNLENMNRLINAIDKANPEACVMRSYQTASKEFCGTAHCFGGWIATLMAQDDPVTWPSCFGIGYIQLRADWLGVGWMDLRKVELLKHDFSRDVMNLAAFDGYPAHQRQRAMVALLRHWRDTGNVNWPFALNVSGIRNDSPNPPTAA